jgi:hypothetical protein
LLHWNSFCYPSISCHSLTNFPFCHSFQGRQDKIVWTPNLVLSAWIYSSRVSKPQSFVFCWTTVTVHLCNTK